MKKTILVVSTFALMSFTAMANIHTNGSELNFKPIKYGHFSGDCFKDADAINKLQSDRFLIKASCNKVLKNRTSILGLPNDSESYFEVTTKVSEK